MEVAPQVGSEQLGQAMGAGIMTMILGMGVIWFLMIFVFYLYFGITGMMIAKKTQTENGWFAWVPILNLVLLLNIAKKPVWWLILFLIPFVNLVMMIIVWMEVAKARGKPDWMGILLIVPVIGFFIPAYLAFSD